jgi:hypothetical protein
LNLLGSLAEAALTTAKHGNGLVKSRLVEIRPQGIAEKSSV